MTKSYIGFSNSKVLGNLVLDTYSGTFRLSSSGSGTGSTKSAANDASLNAANQAIFTLILAELSELLGETTLAETNILNVITNNVTTETTVYESIPLSKIASTKDGINYVLKTRNILKTDQYCEVMPNQIVTGAEGTYNINNGRLNMMGQMKLGKISSSASGNGIILGKNSGVTLTGNAAILFATTV